MNRRGTLAALAVFGLLVVAVGGIVLAGIGADFDAVGGVLGEDPKDPALVSFESSGVHCVDSHASNSSTAVVSSGANTEITYARNVTLPGPSRELGRTTFERLNESAYVLSVSFEEADGPARECAGVVRYEGTVTIPAGDDPWQVRVDHDGEAVTTLYGDSNSSAFGGSASAGGSVSASDETNTTATTTTTTEES